MKIFIQRILKDYNGQTYWISLNLKSIFNIDIANFPAFLNLAVGYSGDGMITPYPQEDRISKSLQYLLSLDIDLTRIKTNNKFFK